MDQVRSGCPSGAASGHRRRSPIRRSDHAGPSELLERGPGQEQALLADVGKRTMASVLSPSPSMSRIDALAPLGVADVVADPQPEESVIGPAARLRPAAMAASTMRSRLAADAAARRDAGSSPDRGRPHDADDCARTNRCRRRASRRLRPRSTSRSGISSRKRLGGLYCVRPEAASGSTRELR